MEPTDGAITKKERETVSRHYEVAAGPILENFGGMPVLGVAFPFGLGEHASYRGLPPAVPTGVEAVEIVTGSGPHRSLVLSRPGLSWVVADLGAVEIHGWTSVPGDPFRAAYGRIMLEPNGDAGAAEVWRAAEAVLALLDQRGLGAIPVLDGVRGMALWIPFDDGPLYEELRPWLHDFASEAVAAYPELLTTEWHIAERGDRVFVGTQSNQVFVGSALPYTVRGSVELDIVIPVPRDAIGSVANGDVVAANFAEYLARHGDVFGQLRAAIGPQRFADLVPATMSVRRRVSDFPMQAAPEDLRSATVAAALTILRDGKTRDVGEILKEAIARGLLPTSMKEKTLYLALHGYIVRALGAKHTPEIEQIEKTAQFRINRPADMWPDVELPPRPSWIVPAERTALIERLRATAIGPDSEAFEVATCDAFGLLNFVAQHIGGEAKKANRL